MNKILTGLSFSVLIGVAPLAQADNDQTMLVLDASGSMWGKLEGKTKIEIARESLASLVKDWPENRNAGLVVYGHRKKGDCSDIETVIPVGPLDADKMVNTVNALNPKGKTPLSAAVKQAAEALKYTENKATVVLLSDGKETCDLDPCALGNELEKLGVDFTAHVIGFDVAKKEDQAGLRCLAENTGGKFLQADNAQQLNEAFEQTAKAPEPEPVPEPEPLPKASITAPETAIKATEIAVDVEADDGLKAYVDLYAKGKDKRITRALIQEDKVKGYVTAKLRMPALTGNFVLKLVTRKGEILAESPIALTEAEVAILASETATKATAIEVGLDAPEGLNGYIQLHAKGKKKRIVHAVIQADKVKGYKPVKLRLPALTGDFVLKMVTRKGEVMAEKPLTLTEAEVQLLAPETAIKATTLEINLDAPESLTGYIQLHAKGKKKRIVHAVIQADKVGGYKPAKLRLPALTGDFDLKFVTRKGEIMAEKSIALTDADIKILAPESALQATKIEVRLDAPEGLSGYIELHPANKHKKITYAIVTEGKVEAYNPVTIKLPAATGEFTLKWVTRKGETMAEAPIVLEQVTAKITAPETAPMATELVIQPEAPDGLDGYVYLYAKGKKKHITYGYIIEDKVSGYKPVKLRMPALTGDFEIKWLTKANETLAETALQLTDIEVSLTAPEQAEKGTTIPVTLNGPDGLDGYIYLYPKDSKKYATYGYINEDDIQGYRPAKIKLPETTGDYTLVVMTKANEKLFEQPLKVVDEIVEPSSQ